MTSFYCRKFSLIIFLIAFALFFSFYCFSVLLTWDYNKNQLSDFELQSHTDENLPDKSKLSASTVVANSNKNLMQNYHLWSRKPYKINWNKAEEMCNSILSPLAKFSDPDFSDMINIAKNWSLPYQHTEESILNLLSDCASFRRLIPFPLAPASDEEAEFPLAYVVVATRNTAQMIRMFRAIYQPQNAYCVTYDNKSSLASKLAVKKLVECFDNAFLSPNPENIYYADYSIVRSVMTCMRVLMNISHKIPWRYIQIVSWNDFPLRTNYEMIRIFQILNGSQDSALDRNILDFYVFDHNLHGDILPSVYKPILPDGLIMYKGSHATSMTREFIEFIFANPTAREFFKWLNGTRCPEEHFWATLIHNLHLKAPGPFPGECQHFYAMRGRKKPFLSRYQIWTFSRENCQGKMTNWSCVYGVGDLAPLLTRPELVAHKIYEEFQPLAAFCLERWFWNRRRDGRILLNETYYRTLPSVRYHNLKDKENFVC